VQLVGCTVHSAGASVTQQARQMTWALQDRELSIRYLIRDHDTRFIGAFDTVFESEGVDLRRIGSNRPSLQFPQYLSCN
jgi:putative transposase